MLKRPIAALLLAVSFIASAGAQQTTPDTITGGIYNTTPPSLSNFQKAPTQLDNAGNAKMNCVVGCSGGGASSVTTTPAYGTNQTTTDSGTKINAASMPAGGVGLTGWLSAISYLLTQPLTVTVSGGNVGGYDFFVSTTPTIQNASYVSGNCMGGFQAVAVGTTTGLSGIIDKFTLISKGALVTAKQIYVFTTNPSTSTCTDKSTFTIATADLPKLITSFSVTPAVPTGGAASVGEASNLVDNFVTAGNADIYIAIVETTTETPASTSDLIFNLGGVKDAP